MDLVDTSLPTMKKPSLVMANHMTTSTFTTLKLIKKLQASTLLMEKLDTKVFTAKAKTTSHDHQLKKNRLELYLAHISMKLEDQDQPLHIPLTYIAPIQ